jgi:hypothetical protein
MKGYIVQNQSVDVLHGHEEYVLRWEEAAQWGLIQHHKQPTRSILQHV